MRVPGHKVVTRMHLLRATSGHILRLFIVFGCIGFTLIALHICCMISMIVLPMSLDYAVDMLVVSSDFGRSPVLEVGP